MNQLVEFAGNHPLLMVGVIAAGLAVLFNELRLKSQSLGSVSVSEAVRLINSGAAILDVREAAEFADAHMIDAENVAPDGIANHKRLKNNKAVLLVCDNGAKSAKALVVLRKEGFNNTFSLKGGLAAWQQENYPVESS